MVTLVLKNPAASRGKIRKMNIITTYARIEGLQICYKLYCVVCFIYFDKEMLNCW